VHRVQQHKDTGRQRGERKQDVAHVRTLSQLPREKIRRRSSFGR
jgi:hypothetical protein